jgi:hypothetical protein
MRKRDGKKDSMAIYKPPEVACVLYAIFSYADRFSDESAYA